MRRSKITQRVVQRGLAMAWEKAERVVICPKPGDYFSSCIYVNGQFHCHISIMCDEALFMVESTLQAVGNTAARVEQHVDPITVPSLPYGYESKPHLNTTPDLWCWNQAEYDEKKAVLNRVGGYRS